MLIRFHQFYDLCVNFGNIRAQLLDVCSFLKESNIILKLFDYGDHLKLADKLVIKRAAFNHEVTLYQFLCFYLITDIQILLIDINFCLIYNPIKFFIYNIHYITYFIIAQIKGY